MAPAENIAGPDRKYVPKRSEGMAPSDGWHTWNGSSSNTVEYPAAYASMSGINSLLLLEPPDRDEDVSISFWLLLLLHNFCLDCWDMKDKIKIQNGMH